MQVARRSQPPLFIRHGLTGVQFIPSPLKPSLQVQTAAPVPSLHVASEPHVTNAQGGSTCAVSGTMSSGALVALLAIVRSPLTAPRAIGASSNTWMLAELPAASMAGAGPTENGVPPSSEIESEMMLIDVLPVLEIVRLWLSFCPGVTFPKSRKVGWTRMVEGATLRGPSQAVRVAAMVANRRNSTSLGEDRGGRTAMTGDGCMKAPVARLARCTWGMPPRRNTLPATRKQPRLQLSVAGEAVTPRERHDQHELSQREHRIDEVRRGLRRPASRAAGAEASTLAGRRDEVLMAACVAAEPAAEAPFGSSQ
jgi:hypothetical protein